MTRARHVPVMSLHLMMIKFDKQVDTRSILYQNYCEAINKEKHVLECIEFKSTINMHESILYI